MNPVGKAVWYIEGHLASDVTLNDVATAAEVSRYHLSRAFGTTTGIPLQRYMRERRLSEAARLLANGAPDILSVALQSGYGSHEAFTRAFRDLFGLTPEIVREQRHIDNLRLTEALKMNESAFKSTASTLQPPHIVKGELLLVAGLSERYGPCGEGNMPAQWQRFAPYLGNVPGQVGQDAFGVVYNSDDEGNADYLCGVAVNDFAKLPAEFSRLRIAPQTYAVFKHDGHIASIRESWQRIWNWLPELGHQIADAPEFERYGAEFDGRTGLGGLEIWIPIRR